MKSADDVLIHFGITGMKWGHRKRKENNYPTNGQGAKPRMLTKSRQIQKDKQNLDLLEKGKHISVGMTKERQAQYDERDKAILRERISKFSTDIKKTIKVQPSEDAVKANRIKRKRIPEMSNAELKAVNERLQLERQYKELSKQDVSKGRKWATDILENSAKQTLQNQVAKWMGKGVEAGIEKLLKM